MKKIRLMDTIEDYKKLGVNPDFIERWEEQRRTDDSKGTWEWWYFDGIMNDGSKIVIQFFTKTNEAVSGSIGAPNLAIKITTPDGVKYEEHPHFSLDETTYGKGKCDVHFGKNKFVGDFKDYEIHVEPVNGLGADLKIHSVSQPYRPGTAYFEIGDKYYTWLCAMPKGEVTGTITVNGEEIDVCGTGYHDHQWGTMNLLQIWNHWLWSRQSFNDYSILVFDMTAQRKLGSKRFPIMFIEDKDGRIIFESHNNVKYDLLESYVDDESGKVYPKSSRYEFENDDKKVVYTITEEAILENTTMGKAMPLKTRIALKAIGLNPSYARYSGTGTLIISEKVNDEFERSGELIFEFMYPGKEDFTKFL